MNGGGGGVKKRNNHVHNVNVSLRDIYFGTSKTLKIKINKSCLTCKTMCNPCNGSGQQTLHQRMGPFTQVINVICSQCNGVGILSNIKSGCINCNGKGETSEEKKIKLNIEKGTNNGHEVVMSGLGDQIQKEGEIPGDLILKIIVEHDPNFRREGNHLLYKTTITNIEAIIGKELCIPHYDEMIIINTSNWGIINPKIRYIIKGKGFLNGDLIIEFDIKYIEKKLSEDDLMILIETCRKIHLM
jgi:DnaJ-class molecular chaperone